MRRAIFPLSFLLLASAALAQDHPVVPGFERFGAADPVDGGRLLLGELNCISCHQAEAPASAHLALKKAPILTEAGSRLAVDWVRAFVADPQKTKPGTTMPRTDATPDEAEALAHFVMSLRRAKPYEAWGGPAVKAKELFARVGCAVCHAPLEGPAPAGSVPLPDLRAKYSGAAALAAFLHDPHAVRPSGRMPKLSLTPGEAMALAASFVGLPPKEADEPTEDAPGMQVDVYVGGFSKMPDFDALKSVSSATASRFDPKLAKKEENYAIRFRGYLAVPVDGIYTFSVHSDDGSVMKLGSTLVVNNDGIHGGQEQSGSISLKKGKHAFMVGFFQGGGGAELRVSMEGPGLSKREIPPAALSQPKAGPPLSREQNHQDASFQPNAALVEKGRALFAAKRCSSCHTATPDLKPEAARPLAQLKPSGGCLEGKPLNYSLSAGQAGALAAALKALPGLEKPTAAQKVHRAMLAFNCYACHERDRRGGPAPDRNALFVTTGDDMGDEGRLPPHLNGVGDKLRREWLNTLLGSGTKVRPYMSTRMPVFGSQNLGTLADDVVAADASDAPAGPPRSPDLVKAGRLLTGTKGMSCVTCHTFQNHKSLGIQGMDLVHMSQRLRRDWFAKYLLDPPSLRPGTRMPTYWPEGKSVRKDILDGDTGRQIEALWQYLSEGGKAQIPVGLGPQPIPLVPVDEALIYRNFIQGAGPRAIAVGYPEKIHLAFDANALRPALLWRGDFIDASKHWVDRGAGFQSPAGDDVVVLTDGAPFAVLPEATSPWPKASGHAAGYQFGGYTLDAKRRPTFEYAFGRVQVRDFFEAVDAKPHPAFKRTITIQAPDALWFRAAAGKKVDVKDGVHVVDGGLKLKIEGAGPVVRQGEVLVPIKAGDSVLTVTYSW